MDINANRQTKPYEIFGAQEKQVQRVSKSVFIRRERGGIRDKQKQRLAAYFNNED